MEECDVPGSEAHDEIARLDPWRHVTGDVETVGNVVDIGPGVPGGGCHQLTVDPGNRFLPCTEHIGDDDDVGCGKSYSEVVAESFGT